MANDASMSAFSDWRGQDVQWQYPVAGSRTYQTGDRSGGKHGVKGSRERLWSDEFGGGFLDREIVPQELLDQLAQQYTLPESPELMAELSRLSQQYSLPESPATTLARAGVEQAGRQAFSLAASGGGSPAQSMWMAQNANNQAALSMLPEYAAMNADWEAREFDMNLQRQQLLGQYAMMNTDRQAQEINLNLQRQQLLGQLGLGEQSLNDAAALGREQLLQNYVNALYQGKLGQQQADKNFWSTLAGGVLTAAGAIGGAFVGGPAGVIPGAMVGNTVGKAV